MAKQYKIKISPEGKIDVEAVGFKGKSCLNSIEVLEDLLGATVVDSDFLDDYYVVETLTTEEESTTETKEDENIYIQNG